MARRTVHFIAFAFFTIAIAYSSAWCADKPATIRVALLGTGADPRVQAIRELAEVQLAQGDHFQMLDRQEVERIMTEQHLAATGLVDVESAVKLGKILAVDLLAVVESDPRSQGAAFVVFDPATGVRLWDAGLGIENGSKAADALAAAILDAAAKFRNPAALHTICLMTVRNADLPRDMDGFCDAVGRLLERNLVGSSSVALLERGRLEQVSKERAIAPGENRGSELRASLVTVELEISRGADGHGLRAAAFLSDSEARSLGKLTAANQQEDPVALASDLAGQFADKLKLPPGAAGDRAIEAARFFREAQLRTNRSDYAHALVAAEAAHALAPANVVCHATLARALVFNALPPRTVVQVGGAWVANAPMPSYVLRGTEMIADLLPLTADLPPRPASVARGQLKEAADVLRDYVALKRSRAVFTKSKEPEPEGLDTLSAPLRRYLLKEDELLRASANESDLRLHLQKLVFDMEFVFSRDSAQWSEDLVHCIEEWLDRRAQTPAMEPYADMAALDDLILPHYSWFDNRTERRWAMTAADYERFVAIEKRMQVDRDPVIEGYGDLLGLSLAVARAQNSPEQMKREVDAFVAVRKRLLAQPGTHDQPATLRLNYHLMCMADRLLDGTIHAGQISVELLDFSLSRGEIETTLALRGVANGLKFNAPLSDAEKTRRIAVIQRLLEVREAPGTVRLSANFNETQFRVMLEKLQRPNTNSTGFATTRPWISQKQLLDVFDVDGLQAITYPIIDGDWIYLLGASGHKHGDPYTAQLLRIPLAGGPIQPFASLRTPIGFTVIGSPQRRLGSAPDWVTGACLAEGKYCAATRDQGIMVFPTDGSPAVQLTEKEGLPTNWCQSIALLDGMIYAGLGKLGSESYLVSCDLSNRRVDVLASNVRRDRKSPLDDGTAFSIRGLVADPPRHRLIVVVQRYEPKQQVNGIWEYKPANGQWKQLLPMALRIPAVGGDLAYCLSVNPVGGERINVMTASAYFQFDLRTDRALVLFHTGAATDPFLPGDTPLIAGKTAGARNGSMSQWPPANGAAAFASPWVWSSGFGQFPWSRCNILTGQREYFGTLRPEFPVNFQPRFLTPVAGENSRILVGDYYGLWLLAFGNAEKQDDGKLQ
jgi:hypothetical protein